MKSYKFKFIQPIENGKFTQLSNLHNAIFLAGPCPRSNYNDDWRYTVFDILDRLGFTGTVITPTNPEFSTFEKSNNLSHDDMRALQVNWERIAMHSASAIVFWIPRDSEHPGMTTNVEFGEWYKKDGIFAGWPETAEHVKYLECKLTELGKPFYHTLEDTLKAAVESLNRAGTFYFTADTHFKQQRTLELSRRPFYNVAEMDLTMISNWNKTVRMNDIVYHAGDFIDPDKINKLKSLLGTLNFKELHWTLGNYDRKVKDKIIKIIGQFIVETGRIVIIYDIDSAMCMLTSPATRKKYMIVHEPANFAYDIPNGTIVLYGHIHGRSFAKKNGFDLATDYHKYTPLSMEQVDWFANAMNYWDENVYCDSVTRRMALSND